MARQFGRGRPGGCPENGRGWPGSVGVGADLASGEDHDHRRRSRSTATVGRQLARSLASVDWNRRPSAQV